MQSGAGASADRLLLALAKGRVFGLCVEIGIVMSALALIPAAFSTSGRWRQVAAIIPVLVAWLLAEFYRPRREWIPEVLEHRRWALGAAVVTFVPYAIDGRAQSVVFMALAPLGGIAAAALRRRDVLIFAVSSIFGYLLGVLVGAGSIDALTKANHPFDAGQQVVAIAATCGMFAYVFLHFRRFIEHELSKQTAGAGPTSAEPTPTPSTTQPDVPAEEVVVSPEGDGASPQKPAEPDRETDDDAVEGSTSATSQDETAPPPRRRRRREYGPAGMTRREVEVFDALAEDLTQRQVAKKLGIEYETVRSHVKSARHKLKVKRQEQVVSALKRWRQQRDQPPGPKR